MKKSVGIALSAALLAASLTGCGSSTSGSDKAGGDAASAEKTLKITMMTPSFAGGGWDTGSPIVQTLDKKLNIDLDIQWVPSGDYEDKLNVLAASNNFPDVYAVTKPDQYLEWQSKGAFVDLTPYLQTYPNMGKYFTKSEMETLNPKDKVYGLPFYNTAARDSLAIRKDWLDKLQLKMPTTIDELYLVAKAFVEKDPDGNGQKDTIGISIAAGGAAFDKDAFLEGGFGLGNQWQKSGGKLVPMQAQASPLKDYVAFLKKAYAEGVLDKDFAINKASDPLDKFTSGKVGIAYVNPNELYTNRIPSLQKVNPKAEVVQLAPPKGPTGIQAGLTYASGQRKTVINAKIDKDKQERILKMLDYILSDEGYNLIKNGIEGVHYQKQGDKYVKLPAYDTDRPSLLSTWFIRRDDPLIQVHIFDDQDYAAKLKTWFDTNDKYVWENPADGLVSPTNVSVGKDINTKWLSALVKIIVGQGDISGVDKAVADWKAGGGDKITQEINDSYAKLN